MISDEAFKQHVIALQVEGMKRGVDFVRSAACSLMHHEREMAKAEAMAREIKDEHNRS